MAIRGNDIDHSCPACLLVVIDGNPRRASITNALRTPGSPAPKVTIVAGAAEALRVISREPVRAVLIGHRPDGAGEQRVRAVVEAARGRPVIWLLEDDDVVEVAEAVVAGVSGAFYWDQLGPELLSAIDRLAPQVSSDPVSLPTNTSLRRAGGHHRDPVSADSGSSSRPYPRMASAPSVSEASTSSP